MLVMPLTFIPTGWRVAGSCSLVFIVLEACDMSTVAMSVLAPVLPRNSGLPAVRLWECR
jgi:hypothetical protein